MLASGNMWSISHDGHDHNVAGSRGSSVSILTNYGLDNQCSIPGRGSEGIYLSSLPPPALGPPTLLSKGYRGSYPGCKATEGWAWPLTSIQCRG